MSMAYGSVGLLAVLCLALLACLGPVLGSTTESPECASFSLLPDRETEVNRITALLEDGMDIIEVHFRSNATFNFTDEFDGTDVNKTLDQTTAIEAYNTFIYFIVTETGKSIMKYPVDADFLSFGILGSRKKVIYINVESDPYFSPEQFRKCCIQELIQSKPIRSSETSVCYFQVSNTDTVSPFFWPYYTYNTFKTICESHGTIRENTQEISNKLLWWFCVAFFLTLPVGIAFVPHSVHRNTNTYRREDVPYSVTMFLSYIYNGKVSEDCFLRCICNFCLGAIGKPNQMNENSKTTCKSVKCPTFHNIAICLCIPTLASQRQFLFVSTVSFLLSGGIHLYLRTKNELENDFTTATGSSGLNEKLLLSGILFIYFFLVLMRLSELYVEYKEYYAIYIVAVRDRCLKIENINDSYLQRHKEPLLSAKMISELYFTTKFWWKIFTAGTIFLFPFNFCFVILFSIPFVNMTVRNGKQFYKYIYANYGNYRRLFFCTSSSVVSLALISCIGAVNIVLMQPLTLLFQSLFMTLFVGIPIYPKFIGLVILIIAAIKFYTQEILAHQTKMKHILDSIFNCLEEHEIIDKNNPSAEIPKEVFSRVYYECPSVNACTALIKVAAFTVTLVTVYHALDYGGWIIDGVGEVIPTIFMLIGPDFLSTIFYNQKADERFIEQCVTVLFNDKMGKKTQFQDWVKKEIDELIDVYHKTPQGYGSLNSMHSDEIDIEASHSRDQTPRV